MTLSDAVREYLEAGDREIPHNEEYWRDVISTREKMRKALKEYDTKVDPNTFKTLHTITRQLIFNDYFKFSLESMVGEMAFQLLKRQMKPGSTLVCRLEVQELDFT
jgi:hypothetical protein